VEEGGLAYDTVRQQGAATQMELTSGEKIGAMGRSSVLIPERGGGEADWLVDLSAIVTFSICLNTFEIDS
jgi:hypothetical protein